jgi:hypothetical protein
VSEEAPSDPPPAGESEGEAAPVTAKAASSTPATSGPRRKRRKRAAASEADAAPPAKDPGEPEEDERLPSFARAWPRDPALDALVAAFDAGDYARVRREAPALARQTEDDAVRRAARELRRRLDPDPLAVYILMAAGVLLAFLAGWYWLHPHTS